MVFSFCFLYAQHNLLLGTTRIAAWFLIDSISFFPLGFPEYPPPQPLSLSHLRSMFCSETPFHLVPLPNRGMRQVDAEVVHHYPGYVNPLVPTMRQAGYMSEEHRLRPFLTVDDELRHERRLQRQRQEYNTELRRSRYRAREEALQRSRDQEHERQLQHAAMVAGTNQKNMGSDNRDVITHQCHTREAQDYVRYKEDLGKYKYHQRQREVDARLCPTGYNTITWQPRPRIAVPPVPVLPPTVDPSKVLRSQDEKGRLNPYTIKNKQPPFPLWTVMMVVLAEYGLHIPTHQHIIITLYEETEQRKEIHPACHNKQTDLLSSSLSESIKTYITHQNNTHCWLYSWCSFFISPLFPFVRPEADMASVHPRSSTAAAAAAPDPSALEASTLRFVVTSDNHLGYAERDPRRGDDSFTTFEEVLRIARLKHDADAMLLGGDLFHENKPSLGCLVRVGSLLRKYAFGDRDIQMELLSDPAVNFPSHAVPLANFQDPNVNIALPIFAIHGNHDDPVGGTSALDVLSTNACINYFGLTPSLEEIQLHPILLRKGKTYVALYGLGHVRDERLLRCFKLKKVHFVPPPPLTDAEKDDKGSGGDPTWFRMLIVHQNRSNRPMPGGMEADNTATAGAGVGSVRSVEQYLAGFGLDLVIWGNEHMQRMAPQTTCGYDIIQPGSTIRTALPAQYSSPPKQCGVLEIRGSMYRMTPVTLRSVRPFVSRVVEMAQDFPRCRTLDAVEAALRGVVNEMIMTAEREQVSCIPEEVLAFHPNLKYPLIALAVDFSDASSTPFPQPNYYRLGQEYMEVVANPQDMVKPLKRPSGAAALAGLGRRDQHRQHQAGEEDENYIPVFPSLQTNDIRAKIAEIFNAQSKDVCGLLSEVEVSAAVYAFAEKGERSAIDERIVELLSAAQKSAFRRLTGKQAPGRRNGADAADGGAGASSGAPGLGYGEDAVLSPEAIAAVVARHKQEVNKRYAEALQQETAQQEKQLMEQQQQQQQQRRRRLREGEGQPLGDLDDDDLDDEDEGDEDTGGDGGKSGVARRRIDPDGTNSSTAQRHPIEETPEQRRQRRRAALDEAFDAQHAVVLPPEQATAGLLQSPPLERVHDPLLSAASVSRTASTMVARRGCSTRTTVKPEPEEEQVGAGAIAAGPPRSHPALKREPGRDGDHLDEGSDADSLDELLFASRRLVPADAAVDRVLRRAQEIMDGGDQDPPREDGGSSPDQIASAQRGKGGGARRPRCATGTAVDDMIAIEDDDDDDADADHSLRGGVGRRGGAQDRGRGRTAGSTTAPRRGRGQAAATTREKGKPGEGFGSTSTRRKPSARSRAAPGGGGPAGGGFMGLPLYVPGEGPDGDGDAGNEENDAMKFLSSWASQKR
eukprot:gene10335-7229_t